MNRATKRALDPFEGSALSFPEKASVIAGNSVSHLRVDEVVGYPMSRFQ